MAIEFQETFQVSAPIDAAWQFMMTPENIVTCMPGASLAEIIDDKSFVGNVKLKVGAVTAKYQGKITYTSADKSSYSVNMLAEGTEKGGGTVSGTIIAKLKALPDGGTEVECSSSIDLTGRIIQVGRGMIQGVSQQIIKKFVTNAQKLLEEQSANRDTEAPSETSQAAQAPQAEIDDSINLVAVVCKVLWDSLSGFFKRILGRA